MMDRLAAQRFVAVDTESDSLYSYHTKGVSDPDHGRRRRCRRAAEAG